MANDCKKICHFWRRHRSVDNLSPQTSVVLQKANRLNPLQKFRDLKFNWRKFKAERKGYNLPLPPLPYLCYGIQDLDSLLTSRVTERMKIVLPKSLALLLLSRVCSIAILTPYLSVVSMQSIPFETFWRKGVEKWGGKKEREKEILDLVKVCFK